MAVKRSPPKLSLTARLDNNFFQLTKSEDMDDSFEAMADDLPRVIVKFRDYVDLPYANGIESLIEERKIGPWYDLAKEFEGIKLTPLFSSPPKEIQRLVQRAINLNPKYKAVAPNFLTYFAIDVPEKLDPYAIAKRLSTKAIWPNVETAYVQSPAGSPPIKPHDDIKFLDQGYLGKATSTIAGAIGAECAWCYVGGDGNNVALVDIELGWYLDQSTPPKVAHADLVAANISLLSGLSVPNNAPHGTSVLGIIAAQDNSFGCVGIAQAATVKVIAQKQPGLPPYQNTYSHNIPDAIMKASIALASGDVMLIEAHTASKLPVEIDPAVFTQILLATNLNIIVVEAAGNGSHNLNTHVQNDSGAILVGASTSTPPYLPLSNWGQRIDSFAWGENVTTTSYDSSATPPSTYTNSFSGTSAASAIVAGAAVALQGIAKAKRGMPFAPPEVRTFFRTRGIPSGDLTKFPNAKMPDLQQIIQSEFGTTTDVDVYIRDFVGDAGVPHSGPVAVSPDIILRRIEVADPHAEYGEGSGTENNVALSEDAVVNQDCFVYVRARNRGQVDAPSVKAKVYWSPVATLPIPSLWTLIGESQPFSVSPANVLTVSNSIKWLGSTIPASGHYCFVALVDSCCDKAPPLQAFSDWSNYVDFIRTNNNVTWRNFNVVENTPQPLQSNEFVELEFLATGAPNTAALMTLEFVNKLPKGSKVMLRIQSKDLSLLHMGRRYEGEDKSADVLLIPLDIENPYRTPALEFPSNSKFPLTLMVSIPEEFRRQSYDIFVSQLWKGSEVGRITWRLVPPKNLKN
jgi:serine protease